MKDQEPLDLSLLSVEGDSDRWRELTRQTITQVDQIMARRNNDPVQRIATWGRPVALAAAIMFAMLIPVEWMLELREPHTEEIQALVQLSTSSVLTGADPSGAQLVEALGRGTAP